MGGLIVNKRKRIVYFHDSSIFYGNGAIIATERSIAYYGAP